MVDMQGIDGTGGHLRPYLWVTCDPTPLKPKTGSLATLPLFTAPATQNYTWSLATLPTTTRENPARSLATLPTQIGRVTSDHEPHTLHTFAFVRPYLTSFYQNFPSPLQPMLSTTFLLSKTFLLSQFPRPLQPMLSTTTFLLSKTFFLSKFSPPLQPMLSTTTFLLSKTFLLSQFSPPSAAHAFNYNIPFIKNIPFITISPPSAAHAFNYNIPFIKNILFIKIFPPSAAHAFNYIPFIKNIPFITIFPPSAAHAFNYNIPFIKNITFITISPPSAAHNIADTHLPLCDPTWLPFIKIFPPHLQPMLSTTTFLLSKTFLLSQFSPPLCSPQHSRHTFAFVRPYLTSFYQNFTPPLQPMLSTTFLLSKTFLLSQFSPPSAAHAFNYNIPFIKNIPFITIFPPLCSPQHSRHTFAFVRPYLTSFYQNFSPLCSPCFQLQHSFYQKHSFYHNFPTPLQPTTKPTHICLCATLPDFLLSKFYPPSAAHAFNYIPSIKNIPFITIFPLLCSPCFQLQHSFYQKHSFYHNLPPPLQPMLSTTTFLLSKTLLLSQFPPPLQPTT